MTSGLAPAARRPLVALATATAALLLAVSGRYGYHRDELYFLQAGQHLAWGYPDQPPLTPALARLSTLLAPDSLLVLRVFPALAAAAIVLLTGLLARELGGGPSAQLLAAGCLAVSAILLSTGHLFGTTVVDLLGWTAISWVAARLLRGGTPRWWLALGLIVGVALLNKALVAVLPLALLAGVLITGPRQVLRTRWFPIGVLVALLVVAPSLWWQATNGWPQLTLSAAIAAGESGTSEPRWLFLPYQFVLVSPVLAPVWICGLIQLFRSPALAALRAFGWAYVLLVVAFLAAGGKPYYLAGMFPVLLAAGAPAVVGWLGRRTVTGRRAIVTGAVALTLLINSVLMLPVLPVTALSATPIVEINYDAGETVGWPAFVRTVAGVVDTLPAAERAGVVLLAGNYGEAGALDRFGPALGLPAAYSGHNAFHEWGPPTSDGATVVAVGLPEEQLRRLFGSVEPAATIDNGVDLDNEEQGRTVWICRGQTAPWSELWPTVRRYG